MKGYLILGLAGIALGKTETDIPAHYDTENGDQLMRLLISKGFAQEKEDNID